ncbi:hypothetical protein [Pseudomonas savastanoi]|nr:hypothetical protein [Pseudomonas savastanoi]
MLDVSGKDNQTAHFGLTQKMTVFAGQPGAGDIDHQGALQARTHRKNPYTPVPICNPGMVLDPEA